MNRLDLIDKFTEFLDKQDTLAKAKGSRKLQGFSYLEMHTISAIGDLESPNVTSISKKLNVTRGAISKIAKKFIMAELVETYMEPNNKQKIFYKLTPSGKIIYNEHAKLHSLWCEGCNEFLSRFSDLELNEVMKFMVAYNKYLDKQIEDLKK